MHLQTQLFRRFDNNQAGAGSIRAKKMADSHWGHDWAILDNGNTDKTERCAVVPLCTVGIASGFISFHVVGLNYERR